MKKDGQTAIAIFDSMYTEHTRKGNTSYSTKYTYKVDSVTYGGTYKFKSLDSISTWFIPIVYNPSNPDRHETDIDKALQKKKESANSKYDLILGLIFLGGGLYLILHSLMSPRRPKRIDYT